MMERWHDAVRGLGVDLGGGRSFDLDFHKKGESISPSCPAAGYNPNQNQDPLGSSSFPDAV